MSEEEQFLRALCANPEDTATRLVYADWLEERGARAEFLRADPDLFQPTYADWLETDGSDLNYYLDTFPELRAFEEERTARKEARQRLLGSGHLLSPSWLALLRTLGSPFHPFFFWNNTGPRAFADGELPLTRQTGTRGLVVTFEGAFRDPAEWGQGLTDDLQLLTGLELGHCEYGAACCPLHPFLCELPSDRWPLTGADVLAALNARHFRSDHIPGLDAPDIDFPGYHPRTNNDEIHNRFRGQHLFASEEGQNEMDGPHGELKRHVEGGRLWYVLLHPEERPAGWVLLFAVGRSPSGRRLVGVVTHQVCHNLCD